MVDQLVHDVDCMATEDGVAPSLHAVFIPSPRAGTVRVIVYETCQWCSSTVAYCDGREPVRRFHRRWRSGLAVWIATWEHRHDLWDSAHPGS